MTDEEKSISLALTEWFKSQELDVTDGVLVMTKLVGVMIANAATDVDDLAEGLALASGSMRREAAEFFVSQRRRERAGRR